MLVTRLDGSGFAPSENLAVRGGIGEGEQLPATRQAEFHVNSLVIR
ncbi:MAG: hypothetical protein J0I06_15025 [Planctomycetes bacterium]|nr:hypothetical protein [Planctomycetota bacterium]